MTAELSEQRRPAQCKGAADDRHDDELDEANREDPGAAHKTVITATCS